LEKETYQIVFLEEVIKINLFKVFLRNNKYLIISIFLKDFTNLRIVFNIKNGKFLFICRDRYLGNLQDYKILLTEKCWHN